MMILEKWLENHDIKKMVIKDFKLYLNEYKKEDPDKIFKDRDAERLEYKFQWVAYVINSYDGNNGDELKYVDAQAELQYEEMIHLQDIGQAMILMVKK